ncbi:hypothetical protein KC717_02860 [Candidatus Dojkabacteria bacterium]|uniref:Uncharacterized protein n=1 Tax=Candidatus Dojkabacteria bacterium TaxID=2099670 RepID=A0A955L890_9BACT|nr:hypothetical protein [Candidatus Dojkabacteria bacterium]
MIRRIPEKLQLEIDKYFSLDMHGTNVVCPYYINPKSTRGNLRVMAGKGAPEEIELETRIWAKVKGFDIVNASAEEIREFMLQMKIGVDCSGFVAQILNNYMTKMGYGPLRLYLSFDNNSLIARLRRFLRPLENIGANILTSDLNADHIDDLNEIRPGDLIRAKGNQRNAHHVGIITEVEYDEESQSVRKFTYANSHRFYENQNGMRYGEVVLDNPGKELKDQTWTDTLNGRNYFLEDLLVDYEDNGIRRLKFSSEIGL